MTFRKKLRHGAAWMMVIPAIWLSSCKDDTPQAEKPTARAPVEPLPAAQAPEPKPEPVPPGPVDNPTAGTVLHSTVPPLTPDQEASAVVVRISIASTIEKTFPALLLHHGSLAPSAAGSVERLAVAMMPGMEEVALRDTSHTVIKVQRTKKARGQISAALLNASLYHFDASTGLAIIKFSETFPYQLDAGIQPSPDGGVQAAVQIGAEDPGYPITARVIPAAKNGAAITLAPDGATGEPPAGPLALLDTSQKLSGFAVKSTDGTWTFRSLVLPQVELRQPSYVPSKLITGTKGRDQINFQVEGILADASPQMRNIRLLVKRVSSAAEYHAPERPEATQPPITETSGKVLYLSSKLGFTLSLDLPAGSEAEHHLVQVQLLDASQKPVFTAAPFLVTLQPLAGGVVPSARGITLDLPERSGANPSVTMASADAAAKSLTTESAIQYGIPIREGREVLVKLAQQPYWKRLSLEKGEWLPLPAVDLSSVHLAGNKEALFLLAPAARGLKRYDLQTLAEEASIRLPGESTPLGVAVGNFTHGAPVAVLTSNTILCCDPKSLAVTNSAYSRSAMEGKPFNHGWFIAAGDGSMVQVRTPPLEAATNLESEFWQYAGAAAGFRRSPRSMSLKGLTVAASYEWTGELLYPGPGDSQIQRKLPDTKSLMKGPVTTGPICISVSAGIPPWCHPCRRGARCSLTFPPHHS